MTQAPTLEQRAVTGLGADLVLEGGGVKGIALAGAVITLHEAGYVFPRVAGTSAGALVACLMAAYQARGVDLSQLERDMRELDFRKFRRQDAAEKYLGPLGDAYTLLRYQGLYPTTFLHDWLSGKLDAIGIATFGDLKITDDPDTSLAPQQRYRLVVHTTDLSRKALVRLPWDLPYYLLAGQEQADPVRQIEVIDSYRVVDAVRASMSVPYYFRPFVQQTALGECTWADGGMLQNFPITAFDRTDGRSNRWPTFGVKLSARPSSDQPDRQVRGNLREALSIIHTALGEWNQYLLDAEGVGNRTVYVDTSGFSSLDFALSDADRETLYRRGRDSAETFLADWAGQSRLPSGHGPDQETSRGAAGDDANGR
jgi:NTE family protein